MVAPTTSTLSSPMLEAPSSCTRNSVLIRRDDSWSDSDLPGFLKFIFQRSFIYLLYLAVRRLSISSMKTTEGWWTLATAKRARTIFSPSPTHLEVRAEAEMAKKVERDWEAMHLPGGTRWSLDKHCSHL